VDIKRRSSEMLEHVIRMNQTRTAKTIFEIKPEGRRKVGRPILRLLGDTENIGFDVLTAVAENNSIIRNETPFSPVKFNRCACCFLHAGFLLDLFFGP
jgi:hypothetical protein